MSNEHKAEDRILALVEQKQWAEVAAAISDWHPADIADLIEQFSDDDPRRLFDLVREDIRPDVLAELEPEAESDLVESMTNSELSDIVEDMAPDDAADVTSGSTVVTGGDDESSACNGYLEMCDRPYDEVVHRNNLMLQ